jgi:hypothetical protein
MPFLQVEVAEVRAIILLVVEEFQELVAVVAVVDFALAQQV